MAGINEPCTEDQMAYDSDKIRRMYMGSKTTFASLTNIASYKHLRINTLS